MRSVSLSGPGSEPPPPASRLSIWRIGLGLVVTALVFVLLARFLGGIDAFLEPLLAMDLAWLGLAIASSAVAMGISASKMRLAFRIGGHELTHLECFRAVLYAWPVSMVTPSRAGDFYRAACVRQKVPLMEGFSAVFAEKAVDALVMFFAATVGALWAGHFEVAVGAGAIFATGLIAVLWTSWVKRLSSMPLLRRVSNKLEQLMQTSHALREHPQLSARLIFWSIVAVANAVLLIGALLHAVDAQIAWTAVAASWPVAMVSGALPITPAGMATRDAVFVFLLDESARSAAVLAATFSYALITGWAYALLGLPLLLRSQFSRDD